jgi:hypothetical protein
MGTRTVINRNEPTEWWEDLSLPLAELWSEHGPPDAYSLGKRRDGLQEPAPDPVWTWQWRSLAIQELAHAQQHHDVPWDRDRDRRREDDRPIERFDEYRRPVEPNYALEDGLRPFIERRTPTQQKTLWLLYWLQASVREASRALGSDTSGGKSGAAQSNRDQAVRMLRKELLEAFVSDYGPNDVPMAVPLHRDPGRSPRWMSTFDGGDHMPDRGPVRVRHIDPVPVPRRTMAERKVWDAEDAADLAMMNAHYIRGFPPGFSYGLHRAWAVDCGNGLGPGDKSEGWSKPVLSRESDRKQPPWSGFPATLERASDIGWRVPQFVDDDPSPAIAGLIESGSSAYCRKHPFDKAPGERGGGLHGVPRAFWKVWDGLTAGTARRRRGGGTRQA